MKNYAHVENLYKPRAQTVLLFKEVYILEKIHGCFASVIWKPTEGELTFTSGNKSPVNFLKLFNQVDLIAKLKEYIQPGAVQVTICGEAYGGGAEKMSATYGKELKFVAFDVCIINIEHHDGEGLWLSVHDAAELVAKLGLEFVHFAKVPATLEALNVERDAESVQAIRNGMGPGKRREGIIIRPLVEMTGNNGERICVKHKRDEFMETKTPREVDPAQLKVLSDAQAIAEEWVTPMRLTHVLAKIPGHNMEKMPEILRAMVEDVLREGAGELVDTKEARRAITSKTAKMYKEFLQSSLQDIHA